MLKGAHIVPIPVFESSGEDEKIGSFPVSVDGVSFKANPGVFQLS